LQRVVDSPAENVFIYPGDNIYISHDPRTFTVLGASAKVGRYAFDSERLNLAEAVADAGGFVDAASDPSGVFLFRFEPTPVARAVGVNVERSGGDSAPIIYRLNLREGDGYFLAKQFEMRDKDIVLVANSDGAQLLKFANLVQALIAPVESGAATVLTVKTIQAGGSAVITTSTGVTTGVTGATTTP
jgi:polysaccharide export outer membrane protein